MTQRPHARTARHPLVAIAVPVVVAVAFGAGAASVAAQSRPLMPYEPAGRYVTTTGALFARSLTGSAAGAVAGGAGGALVGVGVYVVRRGGCRGDPRDAGSLAMAGAFVEFIDCLGTGGQVGVAVGVPIGAALLAARSVPSGRCSAPRRKALSVVGSLAGAAPAAVLIASGRRKGVGYAALPFTAAAGTTLALGRCLPRAP